MTAYTARTQETASHLDSISALLQSYQETVRFVLCQNSYPGVSAEELELFKSEFRTSAYTCRLGTCPWATLGFDSESLLQEHELSHLRRFRCTWSDCKYPPFPSAQSLKNHVRKWHNPTPPRKSIRTIPPSRQTARGSPHPSRRPPIIHIPDGRDLSTRTSPAIETQPPTPTPATPITQVPLHSTFSQTGPQSKSGGYVPGPQPINLSSPNPYPPTQTTPRPAAAAPTGGMNWNAEDIRNINEGVSSHFGFHNQKVFYSK